MPGGRPFVLVLQKVFWGTAIVQIVFIGALLVAIIQGNTHRHPVLLAFLMTAWCASWVSLLPLFGGIWDIAKPVPLTRSNLPPGTVHLQVCQANAILVAYFWTAIPGFAFAFSGEVLRILWGVSSQRTSSASTLVESDHRWNWDQDQRSRRPGWLRFLTRFDIVPDRSILWKYFLVAIPLVTSLPAPFITGRALFRHGWRTVHADQFTCGALGEDIQTKVSMVMMCHFVPAFLVGFTAIATYLFFRWNTRSIIRSRIHTRLLLRLAALSLLSALGALAYLILRIGPTGNRTSLSRQFGWVLPMYMISFPLIGASFFVDSHVLGIWRGWLSFGRRSAKPGMHKLPPDFRYSISLPTHPDKTVRGKITLHDWDISWYNQDVSGIRQPPLLPPPRRPPPPPPHLRLLDMTYISSTYKPEFKTCMRERW